jgi:hypothetical protein
MIFQRFTLPGRGKRHTAALLSVSVVAAIGIVGVGNAPSAWACSTASHCWAKAIAGGPDNYGEFADINISCLYIPNAVNGDVVTNELWDASGNYAYWIEAGAVSGYLQPSDSYYNRELFYAYKSPDVYGFHSFPVQAAGDATYPVEMTWVGNNSWDVYVNTHMYTVTQQPMFSDGAVTQAGTEYSPAEDKDGIRDVGSISNIEWQSSNGNWHYEGASMHEIPASDSVSGPGAWINPTYNTDTSTVSWVGPC